MSQPFETLTTKCAQCSGTFKVPAGRRRREVRLGIDRPDFCSRKCNALFVANHGRRAQRELARIKIQP